MNERAQLVRSWGEVLDEWAQHQRTAHEADDHACCARCLVLVAQLDAARAAVDACAR